MSGADPADVERWVAALLARHTADLTRPELLKAIRALSARYVERRAALGRRSPLDSAGKRAAFAAFFAPLHYLVTRRIVTALGPPAAAVSRIVDLGCGTGAASAAWSRALPPPVPVTGLDRSAWALDEARWNWRALGVRGVSRRIDLLTWTGSPDRRPGRDRLVGAGTGLVAAWSVNELDAAGRGRLLDALLAHASRGATLLVIEPVSRAAAPWWDDWADAVSAAGGRNDTWRFEPSLPPLLADLDEAAGFERETLAARSLFLARIPA